MGRALQCHVVTTSSVNSSPAFELQCQALCQCKSFHLMLQCTREFLFSTTSPVSCLNAHFFLVDQNKLAAQVLYKCRSALSIPKSSHAGGWLPAPILFLIKTEHACDAAAAGAHKKLLGCRESLGYTCCLSTKLFTPESEWNKSFSCKSVQDCDAGTA